MTSSTAPSIDLPAAVAEELDASFALSDAQKQQFREDGFIKLSNFFSPELLAFFDPVITQLTFDHNPNKGMADKDKNTYDRAFIQVGNLWEKDDIARALVFSKRAARAAAELLDVGGVRMYHDQALYKEPAGGFTPWHVDQHYWPMDTGKSVTLWFPFTAVPLDMGPLCFGRGSHLRHIARDIAISDESERLIQAEIKKHKILEVFEPYALGEVSFHYGWTLHRAGGNSTDQARRVQTVIYMDQDMRLIEPQREAHHNDWSDWTPGTQIGEVMDSPKNPVLYSF
ncbi:MAG: phytanoyl-CoA dioxygenase family protein [Planctomycetota bacterium]